MHQYMVRVRVIDLLTRSLIRPTVGLGLGLPYAGPKHGVRVRVHIADTRPKAVIEVNNPKKFRRRRFSVCSPCATGFFGHGRVPAPLPKDLP